MCVCMCSKVPKIPWMVIIPFATLFLGYAFKSVFISSEIRLCCEYYVNTIDEAHLQITRALSQINRPFCAKILVFCAQIALFCR